MKRCPQCEFIYEDDQSLCDMDGVLLVLDSRTLPNQHALAPLSSPPAKTQKRKRAVPAFATLILALVLGMVYYVSTQRTASTEASSPVSATSTLSPTTNPTSETQPDQVPAASETESPEKEEEAKPEVTKPSTATPARKTAAKATATSQTKSSTEKKDESKVGSILKKTGRILKKPFKL
jgi:hypothetical protein